MTNLTLPDFPISLVKANLNPNAQIQASDIAVSTTTLPQLLADYQGLVLYFYPKDNTAGCTTQALDFTHDLDKYLAKGYLVIGVSRDSIKSHQNFIQKHSLTIGLISDSDEKLCQHFDVIKEKKLYGKTHLGVVRSTFVFDNTGKLILEQRNVKAKEHSQCLLEQLG